MKSNICEISWRLAEVFKITDVDWRTYDAVSYLGAKTLGDIYSLSHKLGWDFQGLFQIERKLQTFKV